MSRSPTPADRAFMRRAIDLAERGWGRVHPNPLVGAVVVRDGVIVGEGHHAEYGGAHAEVAALEAAGPHARGATLYVSLEPCAHHGKTPPCTDAIRSAGVAAVVFGAYDANPRARGGGAVLAAAGLEVLGGVEEEAVRAQNATFFHRLERTEPFVVLKYGLSLDARLGERAGERSAVTGPEAHAEVHRLRAGFDAILVGIGTVLVDDPLLTVRGAVAPRHAPARVVLDADARTPLGSRLVATIGEAPLWIVHADDAPAARVEALRGAGARTFAAARARVRGVAAGAALEHLAREGVAGVLCEGGGRLGSALLAEDRIDRLELFFAPRILGPAGPPAFPDAGPHVALAGWRIVDVARFGADTRIRLDRHRAGSDGRPGQPGG